jgi:type II secretory pathway component GspD/PulD (secretin)
MLIGDRIGYQKKSGDSVQFMESGTRLIFRPTISADGCVRLEIHPERNTLKVNRKSKLTHETAAELTTQVLVHDGATVAIGGLIAEQMVQPTSHNSRKNPLTLIGGSARRRDEDLHRTELVVLVTPRIVTECPPLQNEIQPPTGLDQSAAIRQQTIEANRRQLAKAHYQRATIYVQQGNPVRARQQIEASLRLNAADPDSQRLRNEIIQCFSQVAK